MGDDNGSVGKTVALKIVAASVEHVLNGPFV